MENEERNYTTILSRIPLIKQGLIRIDRKTGQICAHYYSINMSEEIRNNSNEISLAGVINMDEVSMRVRIEEIRHIEDTETYTMSFTEDDKINEQDKILILRQ